MRTNENGNSGYRYQQLGGHGTAPMTRVAVLSSGGLPEVWIGRNSILGQKGTNKSSSSDLAAFR